MADVLYIPLCPHITSLFSSSCLPLIFSPSSLSSPTEEEEEEDLSERPSPPPTRLHYVTGERLGCPSVYI